ncbi:MAG TPA: response regulator transcription factor [Bryobacteraceae bacterium]|nr:response regulator transcription factor [Bryobacteraceae bacterium]
MNCLTSAKTVAVCDTEPVAIEGMRAMLSVCEDLRLVGAEVSLFSGMEMIRETQPDVVILDKSFGIHAVLECFKRLQGAAKQTGGIVWGPSMTEAEALRMLQVGAHGVVRKTADLATILRCLRAVAGGATWMEEALLREPERAAHGLRSSLTPREAQVVDLVEQGLKNRDIAQRMGIRPGTVKIHLKHIFEKTGIRGRYGLALSGLKEKGLLAVNASS